MAARDSTRDTDDTAAARSHESMVACARAHASMEGHCHRSGVTLTRGVTITGIIGHGTFGRVFSARVPRDPARDAPHALHRGVVAKQTFLARAQRLIHPSEDEPALGTWFTREETSLAGDADTRAPYELSGRITRNREVDMMRLLTTSVRMQSPHVSVRANARERT